jgi:hypothetical protein
VFTVSWAGHAIFFPGRGFPKPGIAHLFTIHLDNRKPGFTSFTSDTYKDRFVAGDSESFTVAIHINRCPKPSGHNGDAEIHHRATNRFFTPPQRRLRSGQRPH